MSSARDRVKGESEADPTVELARLRSLWRLCLGALHTFNNSLSAILGDASYLLEEQKEDPEVAESCASIQREVDRCARLTRALLSRRYSPRSAPRETDLVGLLRDLARLLPDTLGRRFALSAQLPDDLVLVSGDAPELESLVLLLVHQLCDGHPQGGELVLRLERARPRRAQLGIELRPRATARHQTLTEPPRCDAPASLELARTLVGRLGGVLEADGPSRLRVELACGDGAP